MARSIKLWLALALNPCNSLLGIWLLINLRSASGGPVHISRTNVDIPGAQAIYLAGTNEYSGGWAGGPDVAACGDMFLDKINQEQKILPGFLIEIHWWDASCSGTGGYRSASEAYFNNTKYIGHIGGACSGGSMAIADVAQRQLIPQVGYSPKSPTLSDRATYTHFFRAIAPDGLAAKVWARAFYELAWKSVVVIRETGSVFDGVTDNFLSAAADLELTIVLKREMQANFNDATLIAKNVRSTRVRASINLMYPATARIWVCSMVANGMTYMHITAFMYYGTDFLDVSDLAATYDASCSHESLHKIAEGAIYTNLVQWHPDKKPLTCAPDWTPADALAHCKQAVADETARRAAMSDPKPSWAQVEAQFRDESAVMMDAICLWAQSLRELLLDRKYAPDKLIAGKQGRDAFEEVVWDVIGDADFFGVAGPLRYPKMLASNGECLRNVDGRFCLREPDRNWTSMFCNGLKENCMMSSG